MRGNALGGGIDYAAPGVRGDPRSARGRGPSSTASASATPQLHPRVAARRRQDMPFWIENFAGGTNLRGYCSSSSPAIPTSGRRSNITFPCSASASWTFAAWSSTTCGHLVPSAAATGDSGVYFERATRPTGDFPVDDSTVTAGIQLQPRHPQAVGGGLRFFLRSVAVPLVGFDAGYGLESRTWRFTLIIGA